jgi:hypothetical protein
MKPFSSPPDSPDSDGEEDEMVANTKNNIDLEKEWLRIASNLAIIKNTGGEVEENAIAFLTGDAYDSAAHSDEDGEKDDVIGELTQLVLKLRDIEERKGGTDHLHRADLVEEESTAQAEMHTTVKRYVSIVHQPDPKSQLPKTAKANAKGRGPMSENLDDQQKRALEQFLEFTTLDREVAIPLLENCSWDVNTAIEMQFDDSKLAPDTTTASATSTLATPNKRKRPSWITHDPEISSSGSHKKRRLDEAEEEAATRAARLRFEALLQQKDSEANEDVKMADETGADEECDVDNANMDANPELSMAWVELDDAEQTLQDLQESGYTRDTPAYVSHSIHIVRKQKADIRTFSSRSRSKCASRNCGTITRNLKTSTENVQPSIYTQELWTSGRRVMIRTCLRP